MKVFAVISYVCIITVPVCTSIHIYSIIRLCKICRYIQLLFCCIIWIVHAYYITFSIVFNCFFV